MSKPILLEPTTPAAPKVSPLSATAGRGALAALALCMLLAALGTSGANVALPALAAAWGASFQAVQWVALAYLLAITTLIVGVGRLGDRGGRRRLLLGGIGLFTAASGWAAAAPSLAFLMAARAAQGLGAAVMMALALALVGEVVPKARSGAAMGLLGTMSAVGTALGPSLGGLLLAGGGWRGLFVMHVPLGLATLALAWRSLPVDCRGRPAERGGFDAAGTVVLALTLGAYALSLTLGRGHFGALNGALLLAAVVGVIGFVMVEKRATSPLVAWAIAREPGLRAGLAMSALVSTVIMATLVVGPFYLSRALGLDAVQVGLVLSVGPVVAALVGVPAGRLSDRLGATRMTRMGLGGMMAGTALLALLPAALGLAGYVVPLVIVTAGYGFFQTANNTAVMAGAAAERRGVISGLLNLSRNLGLITGTAALGAVFAWGAEASELTAAAPAAVASGMRITFVVATLLSGVALVVAVTDQTRRSRAEAYS